MHSEPADDQSPVSRDDIFKTPQQEFGDPASGMNSTGDFAAEEKASLESVRSRVYTRVREALTAGKKTDDIMQELFGELEKAAGEYARGMKQPSDQAQADEKKLLREHIDTYAALHRDLCEAGACGQSLGFSYEVTVSRKQEFNFGWQCQQEGLWLSFSENNTPAGQLLGFPLCEMITDMYGPFYFGGTPPAARVLRVTDNMILFVSDASMPSGDLLEILATPEEPGDLLPMALHTSRGPLLEVSYTDPACVDIAAESSEEDVLQMCAGRFKAVSFVTSGFPEKKIVRVPGRP